MLKKSIRDLNVRQRQLLLDVWVMAHTALTQERQSFEYEATRSDNADWIDLQDAGYLERIPNTTNRYILTEDTDDMYQELIEVAVEDARK